MGFFNKIKEKVSNVVQNASDAVQSAKEAVINATESMVNSVSELLNVEKIKDGLTKTRSSFTDKIKAVLGVGRKIDDALLEEIEEILITADIGVNTTEKIIEAVKIRVKKDKIEDATQIYDLLKEEILNLLVKSPSASNDANFGFDENDKPHTILVIGVNGVGKTTTIGKLAYNYRRTGKQVIIGAADTFRAAANEQLEIWAERAGVAIVQQGQGADPAAVAFDTLNSAISKNADVVIIDTAGRLHNKMNLMAELEKISRVMKKLKDNAPNDVFLILDATTGQNAIQQANEFMKVANITGIVLTKLDGTAKGGVVIPIASELKIPVRYIGVGEKIDDLQPFDPTAFVNALFERIDDKDNDEVK
jgi:fused signal recognition particle receptor